MKHHDQLGNRPPMRLVTALLFVAGLLLPACEMIEQPHTYTIGVVNLTPILDHVLAGFKTGMTELGYVEGANVTYIYDGPVDSIDQLDGVVQGLVKSDVDLILALSTPAAQVAQRATAGTDRPVVFAPVDNPVRAGLVPDLKHPGGNLTGVTFGVQEGPRLGWLLKMAPQVKRVYVPYNPEDNSPVSALAAVTEAADKLGVEIVPRAARNADEITSAIDTMPPDVDAIFILPDPVVASRMSDFVQSSFKHHLPLAAPAGELVEAGALFSYGLDLSSVGQQAARLVDQIFRGAKPADLPVEMAEFFLTINLKTAATIGLTIPDELVRQADEVIR